jgi:fatty acid desaturase
MRADEYESDYRMESAVLDAHRPNDQTDRLLPLQLAQRFAPRNGARHGRRSFPWSVASIAWTSGMATVAVASGGAWSTVPVWGWVVLASLVLVSGALLGGV